MSMVLLFATVALAYAFSQASEAGRLLMLVGLSAGSLVGGSLAERRGAPLGGAVLLGLGSQLVWAVGAQVIAMSHGLDGAGPIAALAAVVTTVTFALAWLRRAGSFGALAEALSPIKAVRGLPKLSPDDEGAI
jgi:pimeloyl-ACP methyl ester carboxylesterase